MQVLQQPLQLLLRSCICLVCLGVTAVRIEVHAQQICQLLNGVINAMHGLLVNICRQNSKRQCRAAGQTAADLRAMKGVNSNGVQSREWQALHK